MAKAPKPLVDHDASVWCTKCFVGALRTGEHQKEIPRLRLQLQPVTPHARSSESIVPRMHFFAVPLSEFEFHGHRYPNPVNYELFDHHEISVLTPRRRGRGGLVFRGLINTLLHDLKLDRCHQRSFSS
jgi:hypothetical protein